MNLNLTARKKQTAANNEFLKHIKEHYNKFIFKKLSKIMNEEGHNAAVRELKQIKKYI